MAEAARYAICPTSLGLTAPAERAPGGLTGAIGTVACAIRTTGAAASPVVGTIEPMCALPPRNETKALSFGKESKHVWPRSPSPHVIFGQESLPSSRFRLAFAPSREITQTSCGCPDRHIRYLPVALTTAVAADFLAPMARTHLMIDRVLSLVGRLIWHVDGLDRFLMPSASTVQRGRFNGHAGRRMKSPAVASTIITLRYDQTKPPD
jgi:hypothetical protein